jgi:hypothetical protein
MEVRLAPSHIYSLNPSLDFETAKQQAIDKRLSSVAGGLGGLLSRPKPEDVELVYAEIRYESFWHAVCTVRYVFERSKEFHVPVVGAEVRKVTLLGQEFEVAAPQAQPPASSGGFLQQIGQQLGVGGSGARSFALTGVEYCVDENRQERYLDAVNGQPLQLGAEYVKKDKTEVTDLSALSSSDVMIVAPQLSASKIAKQVLSTMTKQIQADKFLEETTTIEALDLYFRPIFAFEFAWKSKNKTGVAEVDAVTGTQGAGKALHTKSDTEIAPGAQFDITADSVTSLMPTAGNVTLVA